MPAGLAHRVDVAKRHLLFLKRIFRTDQGEMIAPSPSFLLKNKVWNSFESPEKFRLLPLNGEPAFTRPFGTWPQK